MGAPLVFFLLLQAATSPAVERFQAGLKLSAQGDHGGARRSFEEAWDMGYRDAYVLYSLIEEDRAAGDKPSGMRHFQLFLERFSESPWLHVLYGNAHVLKNEDEEAGKEYEEALRLNPRLPGVNFRLGYIAFRNNEHTRAEGYFRQELQLSPRSSDASLFLAETLRQLGRQEEAIPYYRKAIALDPRTELAYRALVAALTGKGDLAGAAEVLQQAEEVFPSDASFPAQLARVLTKLHRDEEARLQQARFKTLMEQQRLREKKVEAPR